jgi:transposase
MNEVQPLPAEIWEQTPKEAQALILQLLKLVQEEEKRIAHLEERLGLNSTNSSKPPSTDPPSIKKQPHPSKKNKKKKKRGAQPGHKGHHRILLPTEEVDEVVPLLPSTCAHCQAPLFGQDPSPQRHQVTEIPPLRPTVTEYQLHQVSCPSCGHTTRASLPQGVSWSSFGPRLHAMLAILSGVCFLPRRMIARVMDSFFGVQWGLGSASAMEERTTQALEAPYQEARQAIGQSSCCHLDETGFRLEKKRCWLWVATTTVLTGFLLSFSRSSKVVKELLQEDYKGILVSDRWSAYNWFEPKRRQLCWSHLKREFEKWTLREGESERIGSSLLEATRRLFRNWQRIRDGTLSAKFFAARMRRIRREVEYFLLRASKCEEKKTAGTAQQILKYKESLWTYVREEGVEPTNNAAERALRPAVIWRKRSFGADSEKGRRFVERILTVSYTLRQQKRDVLEFLKEAIEAQWKGLPPPSLLPSPDLTP